MLLFGASSGIFRRSGYGWSTPLDARLFGLLFAAALWLG